MESSELIEERKSQGRTKYNGGKGGRKGQKKKKHKPGFDLGHTESVDTSGGVIKGREKGRKARSS